MSEYLYFKLPMGRVWHVIRQSKSRYPHPGRGHWPPWAMCGTYVKDSFARSESETEEKPSEPLCKRCQDIMEGTLWRAKK